MAAPNRLTKTVTTIQSQLTSFEESISQTKGKRDFIIFELKSMPKVNLKVPPTGGAYYALQDVSLIIKEMPLLYI
jgi:hypothetical protein